LSSFAHSAATQKRAETASITLLPSDGDLVNQSDYILSIVPPKDARTTAQRILAGLKSRGRAEPLYFLDLNAIAPSTSRSIASDFEAVKDRVHIVDGGIIGGPPKPQPADEGSSSKDADSKTWSRPSIVLSGPHALSSAGKSGSNLEYVLNAKHVGDGIGTASGLKCCFASLSKGYTALAIQSFSTAQSLGVLPELQSYMRIHNPAGLERANKGLPGMVTKAGRWIEEMKEIGKTFSEEAGWEGASGFAGEPGIFDNVAKVYTAVAEDPVLSKETWENRKRGKTAEDVVECLLEGPLAKRKKS
jgi:Domain of unknown function (DUF1932)